MRYVVHYGDLTTTIEQWDSNGCLNRIITMHASETRNGIEYPFRYRCITEKYGF